MGRKPVIVGTGSKRGYMSPDPLAGPPLCRCAVCASRRATQLAQALQNKFGPGGRREDPLSSERRRQFIEGLRAVAQFYEENPGAWYDGMHLTLNMYVWGRARAEPLPKRPGLLVTATRSMTTTTLPSSRSSASKCPWLFLLLGPRCAAAWSWARASYPQDRAGHRGGTHSRIQH